MNRVKLRQIISDLSKNEEKLQEVHKKIEIKKRRDERYKLFTNTPFAENDMPEWDGETCKLCIRDQRLAWAVSDELWEKVVGDYNKTVCLECFLELADKINYEIKMEDFIYLAPTTFE